MMDNNPTMVGIVCATVWEIRRFVRLCGLKKIHATPSGYESGDGSLVLEVCGVGPENARRSIEKLLSRSPSLVVSTGFAGALKEGIRAGDLVLDISRSSPEQADAVANLAKKGMIPIHKGPFWSDTSLLMTREHKHQKHMETGAIAVDMESQAVFQACRVKKVPFCSVRAISDTLDQSLPRAVRSMGSGTRLGWKFFRSLISHPGDWGDFVRLVMACRKAERNLAGILKEYLCHQ